VDLRTAAGRELAIVALSSLAADDPPAAADRWGRMAQSAFPLEDQQYVWAVLATHGAYQRVPEAVDWFRKAGATPLTDEQLAWRARIALRQHRWADVNAAVERMSPASRREAAWTYWQGRALVALGRLEEGRKLYARLAGGTDFYGLLAAEELGRPLAVPPPAAPPTAEELAAAAEQPGLKRALLLFRLGLRSEATREWDWAVRSLDDRSLLAASELARRNGLWDRVIVTADRTVAAHDFSLRYPTPYRDALSGQARLRRLDEALVFGLVRQESRFIAYAQSSAGARGLMQLMPATARRVARKIGLKGYRLSRVQQPEVNAALGTGYLRGMLDLFDGSPVLAAAAYNAGPGRAHRWRDATAPIEGAIYIETIPFSETRQYVKKVMANAMHYAALLGGGTQPTLRARLGTIAGAAGSRPPEDE
jgi:soluble lytic murein transglycosylase